MMNYRTLMETLPDVEWEVGDDDEHPGRFYALIRWDDPDQKLHETLRVVNEPSFLSAVEGVLEEWRHMQERPDLHLVRGQRTENRLTMHTDRAQ